MKRERLRGYGLNLKYELETYRHVGKDYGDSKSVNRGWLFNLIRFLRKNINCKEQRYKFCNTYSEWKRHVKDVIPKDICNYDDFLHFLLEEKKDEETHLEVIKIILIPIYVAMFGMTNMFPLDNKVFGVIMMILVAGYSSCFVYSQKKKVEFYEDFINVVEEEILWLKKRNKVV